MRIGGVTLATAVTETHERCLQWYTMPQYHDNNAPASRSTRPLPFPHRCRLCKQIHPTHTVWDCPACKDCHYCKGRDCNGLAPFVRLGPLKPLKSTKYKAKRNAVNAKGRGAPATSVK